MALTGHVSTHAPQSIQVPASIARFSPCSLMALTGQESSHAPQLMHSSEIVSAKEFTPFFFSLYLELSKNIFYFLTRFALNVQQKAKYPGSFGPAFCVADSSLQIPYRSFPGVLRFPGLEFVRRTDRTGH